jgi:hypothetical protein
MQKKYMGRSPPRADLLPIEDAADFLKVDPEELRGWARRGLVDTVLIAGQPHFRKDELQSAAPLLRGPGRLDIGTIAARANLAFATARTVERRLNELVDALGLRRNQLDLHENAVQDLHRRVEDALFDFEDPTLERLRYWTAVFLAIDEAYLLLVREYCGTEEPWTKFMALGHKLSIEAYDRCREPEMSLVLAHLQTARGQLRMTAYFYCRGQHGGAVADEAFGMREKITPRILGLLYQP